MVIENNLTEERGNVAMDLWQPEWVVDVGCGCELGVTIDDGCFVVLYPNGCGQWQLGTHIPLEVAKLLGKLAESTHGYKVGHN